MNINDVCCVDIEKMLYEGSALARYNSVPVFIEGGCPGDTVKIKIIKINKKYLIGEILEIIKPSEYRVKPLCPMFKVCGSCNWQYIDYNEQCIQKRNILKETIKRITGFDFDVKDTVKSPKIIEYRYKIQYPVSQTKVSERIITGYYKKNSHDIVNIKYCPIQPDIINIINEFIKEQAQKLKISGYVEKNNKGLLKHIIYRVSSDQKQILIIFAINSNILDIKLKQLAEILMSKYKNIVGICVNYNPIKTNVIMSDNTEAIIGNTYYIEELEGIKYRVSANSFFQVNPFSAVNIFNTIKKLIKERVKTPTILDAYSGVSSIGLWLCDVASKVVSVEEVKSASCDAIYNAELNNISNIEIINDDASKTFLKFIKNGIKFDVTIIDPPRKGSTQEALENLIQLTDKYLIYVSCNPSTLARDMNILINNGFNPIYIQPFDMFSHTYHIETLVMFEKKI